MKRIFLISIILSFVLMPGCSEEDKISSEPKVTAEVVRIAEPEVEEGAEAEEDIATVRLCHDTDKGIVRWVNGTIFGFYSNATRFEFADYCQNKNYLMEFYCENEIPKQRLFLCKNGCVDDHCA